MRSFVCLIVLVGCAAGGSSPELRGLGDQIAVVGEELRIDLDGTDPDGGKLRYDFVAPASLTGLENRTSMTITPSGTGVFRWTPIATDLGTHPFDFIVSDGVAESVVTINIDVVVSATAPIFRSPLGTGTTLDLAKDSCVELDVVVEDADTADVTLTQEAPVIAEATLTQLDGTYATWQWCPTSAQQAETRHTLVLVADDGESKTIKNYLVVLRAPPPPTCAEDTHEDDDTATQARTTVYPTYTSNGNMTCANDDDWYKVPLYTGEVMTVDLTFTQSNPSEDLDLHLYRDGVDLTPCDAENPISCTVGNGQSADSNERTVFNVPSGCSVGCDYYVVVRGFAGSAAPYGIKIAIQ